MIRLEVLVEGVSDEPAVREVLVRKFNQVEGVNFRIHAHRGRGTLPSNPMRLPAGASKASSVKEQPNTFPSSSAG